MTGSQLVNAGNATVPLSVNMDTTYSDVNGTILVSLLPVAYNLLLALPEN